jgi:hypothetical protein
LIWINSSHRSAWNLFPNAEETMLTRMIALAALLGVGACAHAEKTDLASSTMAANGDCPMMADMKGMDETMNAMMADVEAASANVDDPETKTRLAKVHDRMSEMKAHMKHMHDMHHGTRAHGDATEERETMGDEAAPADEDHSAHHPNE